ncbi:MAG: energy transducer TonB [Treponema sp.]|nr:energy transducer TonB [Treponema sp.]
MNEKSVRLTILIFVILLHFTIIYFVAFETNPAAIQTAENARIIRLIDFEELLPPPPTPPPQTPPPAPPAEEIQPPIEFHEIAETIIEVDVAETVTSGTITNPTESYEFLPSHLVSTIPFFDREAIAREIVFPPIALRFRIEGLVILDLFVDYTGIVQRVLIHSEEPEGRGFGEAAVRVFLGRQGTPATVNGVPVSARFRHPVRFQIQ